MDTNSEAESSELSLLKRGKQGVIRAMFSRVGLIILLLLVQIIVLLAVFRWFEGVFPYFYTAMTVLSACMVLYLMSSRIDPTAKLTWLILIMLLPVFGVLMFLFTQSDIGHRMERARVAQIIDATRELLPQPEDSITGLAAENQGAAALASYVRRSGAYCVYGNTDVTYFPQGEAKWEEMLRQLEQAEHFIFMEYFMIEEGRMWGRILDILARKAKEGLDIRVMYDGTSELALLPRSYPKRLEKLGIKCRVFSPLLPFISTYYNYRDHRKILVIDGHTAFTGGVNLADEYINRIEKYGHWKDTAVMLKGEAVKSFTLMFLQMWSITEAEPDIPKFLSYPSKGPAHANGYILPFGDCPLENDKVGERVYMDILNRSTSYVHIMTPYLILDGEMETALKFAAERGVEVSLILPGIPDKILPYALAKTHYASLLSSGIHIYEYSPGFVHAKVFVADSREAVVGTINLDYRSLYHHFECASYMYDADCIADIERDFKATQAQCRVVTAESCRKDAPLLRLLGFLAKPIAPLL